VIKRQVDEENDLNSTSQSRKSLDKEIKQENDLIEHRGLF
jgi:hypothetical protein